MTEKVLIEINRLKNELDGYSAREALDYIESYINTLSEQQVEEHIFADLESYAQKVEDYYDVGEERGYLCVHRGEVKEAAKECNSNLQLQEYFIKGGIWQKEQMMKEAVEAKVIESFNPVTTIGEPTMHGCTIIYEDENKPYLIAGDKVRIIICKKED